MFLALCLAVIIPYLTLGLATGEARTRMAMSMTEHINTIEIVVGLVFVILGIILILPFLGVPRFF
jgi:cytochrome c biogenesis protein CcdA